MKQVVIVFDICGDTAMYVDGVLHVRDPAMCDMPRGELCFEAMVVSWTILDWSEKLSDIVAPAEVLNELIESQREAIREIAAHLTPDQRIYLREHVAEYVDEIPSE